MQVARFGGLCTVEVYYMQPSYTGIFEPSGRIKRVGVVNFTLAVVPLHETYATSVNQIYCGYYLNHLVKVSC